MNHIWRRYKWGNRPLKTVRIPSFGQMLVRRAKGEKDKILWARASKQNALRACGVSIGWYRPKPNEPLLKGGIFSNPPRPLKLAGSCSHAAKNTFIVDRWFYFAPAESDSHEARERAHGRPKDDLGCVALLYIFEGPYRPDSFSPEAAVNGQANAARPDRVDGHVEELHPHSVEDLESKQSPCGPEKKKRVEHRPNILLGVLQPIQRTRGSI